MKAFDNGECTACSQEVKDRWGKTDAYKEFSEKTKNYSKDKYDGLSEEMNNIFSEFAFILKNGSQPDCTEAQELAKKLQEHISRNYYNCTNEIFTCLGQMYAEDERFKSNIDKAAEGTAQFVCEAIECYCRKTVQENKDENS